MSDNKRKHMYCNSQCTVVMSGVNVGNLTHYEDKGFASLSLAQNFGIRDGDNHTAWYKVNANGKVLERIQKLENSLGKSLKGSRVDVTLGSPTATRFTNKNDEEEISIAYELLSLRLTPSSSGKKEDGNDGSVVNGVEDPLLKLSQNKASTKSVAPEVSDDDIPF